PALAGILETVARVAPPAEILRLDTDPVIGYSVAYPMGVIGLLLAIYIMQRVFRIDYKAEARQLRHFNIVEQELSSRTVRVSNAAVDGQSIRELFGRYSWDVIFTRVRHDGSISLAAADTRFCLGDEVVLVGSPEEVDKAIATLGEPSGEHLELDRTNYDFRRIFVSNPLIAGRSLGELDLPHAYGTIVTRVRRGDIDLLPHGDTVLELG